MSRLLEAAPHELARLVRYFHAETDSGGSQFLPASPFPVLGFLIAGGTRLDIDGLEVGNPTPRAFVVGPLTRHSILHLKPGTQFVSAVLQAGALPGFFAVNARCFANRVTDLHEFLPPPVLGRLAAELIPGRADADAIACFAMLLAGLARAARPPLQIPDRFWDAPVSALAAEAGFSTRHFQRLFVAHFGIAPRELKRFSRYLTALKALIGSSVRRDLAQLAADSGYFDQAHMAHDFRRLAGLSPFSLQHSLAENESGDDMLNFIRYDKKHWSALGIDLSATSIT